MKRLRANFTAKLLMGAESKSRGTAISRTDLPTLFRAVSPSEWNRGAVVLDFGCGRPGTAELVRQYLEPMGVTYVPFDPGWPGVDAEPTQYRGRVDTVVCAFVLNTIPKGTRLEVVQDIHSYLKSGGKAYFGIHLGEKQQRRNPETDPEPQPTGKERWQNFYEKDIYIEEIKSIFGDSVRSVGKKGTSDFLEAVK